MKIYAAGHPGMVGSGCDANVRRHEVLSGLTTGQVRLVFLYLDELAADYVYFIQQSLGRRQVYAGDARDPLPLLKISSGQDLTIVELVNLVVGFVGFDGQLSFDTSSPEGTQRKLLAVSRANNRGWCARVWLEEGIGLAYTDFLSRGVLQ